MRTDSRAGGFKEIIHRPSAQQMAIIQSKKNTQRHIQNMAWAQKGGSGIGDFFKFKNQNQQNKKGVFGKPSYLTSKSHSSVFKKNK